MKKILKGFFIVGVLIFLSFVGRVMYYLIDINYSWLHNYQSFTLLSSNDERHIHIYNNNLDDTTSFYLSIGDRQNTFITKEYLCTGGFSSFSVVYSPSYEVVGIIRYNHSPDEIIALFDFESQLFWAARNNEYNDDNIGEQLLAKLVSYPKEPFSLYGVSP